MAALAVVVALGCAGAPRKPDAFYQPPVPMPSGKPGDALRSEPVEDGPDGARSWRIFYRSTGMKGEPVAVSAMLVVAWLADRFAGKPAPDECVKSK
jgi:hypothetical protein